MLLYGVLHLILFLKLMDAIKTFDDLEIVFKPSYNIEFAALDLSPYDPSLPIEIRKLYAIRNKVQTDRDIFLFNTQDELINYEKLDLTTPLLDIIRENQACWTLKTEVNTTQPQVYRDNEAWPVALPDLLITFVLQELAFSLDYTANGFYSDEQLAVIQTNGIPLWTNRHYAWTNNNYHFYWLHNDSLMMEVDSTAFFATNNEVTYKLLLQEYDAAE